jgi:DNA-binding response OmpR family regulator
MLGVLHPSMSTKIGASGSPPVDETIIIGPDDARQRSHLRLRTRQRAFRIAAECELVTDELTRAEDRNWSDAFGRVLLSSRRLIAVTAPGTEATTLFDANMRPTERLKDLQGEILTAVNVLSAAGLGQAGADSTALQAVHTVRELALNLFATGDVAAESFGLPAAAERPTELSANRRRRVLIVDDDANILLILQRTLQRWGHDVVIAHDGQEALSFMTADIDLVLTDIEMPNLNGIDLLQRLKSDPETRRIPVVVISSLDDTNNVSRCIELGAEDHIPKPFSPEILDARVRASLERKRLHDSETDALRRVTRLIAAAEAVERDGYSSDALTDLKAGRDGLGQLARVFDRMVTSLKSREARLRRRLEQLRSEVTESTPAIGEAQAPNPGPFHNTDVVSGRFEIVGMLGQGGMGTVYHARDRELGEDVALKIVRREVLAADPDILDRLRSEIRLARKISHPNVVRAHDIGEWQGRYYITMEKVSGITVGALLDRRGRLTVESTLAIGTQLCDALAVAHDNQIIHRDIKCANLLIDETGTLKVMDFGIARRITSETGTMTRGGFVIGTPQYMAPELLMGGKPDVRTDLFAVGVVLYECLTGRPPHDGTTVTELFASILDGQAPRAADLVEGIPPQLDALIHQQLRFDAPARSTSARELGQRLAELEHGPA